MQVTRPGWPTGHTPGQALRVWRRQRVRGPIQVFRSGDRPWPAGPLRGPLPSTKKARLRCGSPAAASRMARFGDPGPVTGDSAYRRPGA